MAVTLSQIRSWSIDHLTNAAGYWTQTADHWEDAFLTMRNQSHTMVWKGAGGDALQQRTGSDYTLVSGKADKLRQAAGVARSGASDITSAKRSALNAVDDAQNAGFDVGEDLSVSYDDHGGSAAEQAARQAQAEQFAGKIWSSAAQLEATDQKVAGQINSATADLGDLGFGPGHKGSGAELVDFDRNQPPPFAPWDTPDGKPPPGAVGEPPKPPTGPPTGLPKPLQDFIDYQLKDHPIPNPPAPNVTADQLRLALIQQHIDYDKFVAWFNKVNAANVDQAELLQRIGAFDAAAVGTAASPAGGPTAMVPAVIGLLIAGYRLADVNPGGPQIPVAEP